MTAQLRQWRVKILRAVLGDSIDHILADVWDEGYEAGQDDYTHQLGRAGNVQPTPNPYWED